MRYLELPPPADLADRVRRLWLVEDAAPGRAARTERVIPDGCMELVFHWGAPYDAGPAGGALATQAHAVLAGQLERALLLRPTGAVGMVGARLHPWAGGCLPHASPAELRGALVGLERAETPELALLPERLAAAPDDRARLELLHDALRAHLAPLAPGDRELAHAATHMERSAGRARVGDLARELGRSTRHLQRGFAQRVGLGPKRFARVARLQALAAWLDGPAPGGLAAAAQQLGYADQPHLAREVRALVGLAPLAWRAEQTELAARFRGAGA